MKNFIELIEKAAPVIIQSKPLIEIIAIINEHMDEIMIKDPSTYSEIMSDIHVIANGPYFDLEMATKAVSNMKNEDGTIGQKISIDETNQIASSMGITFDKFNMYDWYYTVNMIYSDYCSMPWFNTSICNDMAKAFLMDRDAPLGKAFIYYKAMCMA